uniref:Uncharacterized protein n=1 Tax=Anguilla anguilla TaxID=7936 RepID=A0A0E9U4K9_ANGAN
MLYRVYCAMGSSVLKKVLLCFGFLCAVSGSTVLWVPLCWEGSTVLRVPLC